MTDTDPHLDRLVSILESMGSVLVCYSGGIDSALVLAAAHRVLGDKAVGMTAVSESLAPREQDAAASVAKSFGARHEFVSSRELDDPRYRKNDGTRCYFCKSELYTLAKEKQKAWGLAHIANGTNLDDLGDFRPGLEAAREANVRSPLVEASFGKEDVRRVAKALGLSIWEKPASACLSSRIPHGSEVTPERLRQIAAFEAALHAMGFSQLRVRWHAVSQTAAAPMARVEVAREELARAFEARDEIVRRGKDAGFVFVTLDLEGYRTGSANMLVSGRSLRVLA